MNGLAMCTWFYFVCKQNQDFCWLVMTVTVMLHFKGLKGLDSSFSICINYKVWRRTFMWPTNFWFLKIWSQIVIQIKLQLSMLVCSRLNIFWLVKMIYRFEKKKNSTYTVSISWFSQILIWIWTCEKSITAMFNITN